MKILPLHVICQNDDTRLCCNSSQEAQNVWMLDTPNNIDECTTVISMMKTSPYMNDSISSVMPCELGDERTFAATILPLQTALWTTPYVPLPTSSIK